MTYLNAPAYDIERPTGHCAFTGRELEPGEAYMATLVEVDEPEGDDRGGAPRSAAAALGLKRLDVSMDQWKSNHRPERLFGYWKSTIAEPNKKKKLFIDDDVLLNLLRRLGDSEEPQRIAFRFVLALVLMRRKMVRYDRTDLRAPAAGRGGSDAEQSDPGSKSESWWILTPKLDPSKGPLGKWKEDEQIDVFDPHLDESQIQQVTEQLSEILEAEL